MELFKTIKQKHISSKQNDFSQQAEEAIRVADFAGNLYIAFNDVPYDPIDPSWTSKEIVERLQLLRQNYVNVKMKNYAQ